jgi:hypothetical protein
VIDSINYYKVKREELTAKIWVTED